MRFVVLICCLAACRHACSFSSFTSASLPLCGSRLHHHHHHHHQGFVHMTSTTSDPFEATWSKASTLIPSNSVGLANFDKVTGETRGLKAKVSFKPKELVTAIKTQDTIFVAEAGSKGCIPGLESIWEKCSGNTRLSLTLLQRYQTLELKGTTGNVFIDAYLRSLPAPEELKSPIHWSDTLLDTFPYDYIKRSTEKQKGNWNGLYRKLKDTEAYRDISEDRFIWAMEVVRSRAFKGIAGIQDSFLLTKISPILISCTLLYLVYVMTQSAQVNDDPIAIAIGLLAVVIPIIVQGDESSIVLLPVIDSCNHKSRNPSCALAFSPVSGAFEINAAEDTGIQAGAEITLSYGDKNNDDLLQYFGFIEEKNTFDRYIVVNPQKSMQESGCDEKLLKAAAALGDEDVLVMDTEEVTTPWDGDVLRQLLEFELQKINAYLDRGDNNDEGFNSDSKRMWELGRIFLEEKSKVLRKCLSKLKDS